MCVAEDIEVQLLPGSGRWMEEMLHKEEQLQDKSEGLTLVKKRTLWFRDERFCDE